MHFTEQQMLAITARSENLLLSAAAGSGKTSVLVARVLALIDEGIDIDRMLVVTFTRAAAADMRLKLTRALSARASQGDMRAHDQLLRLGNASISTLHVFCADLLRIYFASAAIDPAFKILDEAENSRLLSEAMTEALEQAYAAGGPAMASLDFGRGSKKVRALAESLYSFAAERPDPETFLENACDPQAAPEAQWVLELVGYMKTQIDLARASMRLALNVDNCPERYLPVFQEDLKALDNLRDIDDYETLRTALQNFRPAALPRGKKGEDDACEQARKDAQDFRNEAKACIRKLRTIDLPLARLKEDTALCYPALGALCAIVKNARILHMRRKEEQSSLSFSDLEARACETLANPEVRAAVQQQYDCVFVDEYQDVSEVQERLILRVCRPDNLFVVGDVKQSIYRFRLAEPDLFLRRAARYREGDGGRLLPLTKNFRSKPPIIELVNRVFEKVMVGGDAEITYGADERLYPAVFDAAAEKAELHIISKTGGDAETTATEQDEINDAGREGRKIAALIAQMMRENPSLRFSDFAIITRAKTGNSAILSALSQAGIPAYAEGTGGYFESMEIRFALSLLHLINNRRSDVQLIGVLRSCVVGLKNEELARIRIACPEGAFIDAAVRYAHDETDALSGKLRAFFEKFSSWQLRAGAMPLGDFVRAVLDESGFSLFAAALPAGAQRVSNLDRLVSQAASFESDRSGSLSRFLDHAAFLQSSGASEDAQLLGENDDVVRLMTIHKSKGLEFPVVFAAQLSRKYQAPAQGTPLLCDRALYIGMKYIDPNLRSIRTTLPFEAIWARTRKKDAAEEMRLLYVLLTRAKEKLVLVGSVTDAERLFRRARLTGDLPNIARSHMELLLGALLSGEGWESVLDLKIHASDAIAAPAQQPLSEDTALDFAKALAGAMPCSDRGLNEMIRFSYPHALDARRPLKLTASGLLRQLEGPQEVPALVEKPAFLTGDMPLTGAQRGSAYHRALQFLDLARLKTGDPAALRSEIAAQLSSLQNANRLTAAEFAAVSEEKLARFFETEIGTRLLTAQTVMREWSFNVMMRVKEAVPAYKNGPFSEDDLLVQGTIDCCFLENDAWVLVDYKTDRADNPDDLRARYQSQIDIYALALERITGRRVAKRYLCLIANGTQICL